MEAEAIAAVMSAHQAIVRPLVAVCFQFHFDCAQTTVADTSVCLAAMSIWKITTVAVALVLDRACSNSTMDGNWV